nr:hypothetical protein Itr_chr15CG13080 [Ipomoea trifida]
MERTGSAIVARRYDSLLRLADEGSSSLEVKDGASPTPPLETTESPIELPSSPLQAVLTSEVGAALLLGVVARRESEVTGWSRWSNEGEHSAEAVRYPATSRIGEARRVTLLSSIKRHRRPLQQLVLAHAKQGRGRCFEEGRDLRRASAALAFKGHHRRPLLPLPLHLYFHRRRLPLTPGTGEKEKCHPAA